MKERDFDGKLGAVAREIRTPAGVTWSALEELAFLFSQHPSADDPHVRDVLGMARLGVQRLLNLADRLTLMSQLDGERELELQRFHVDLRDVVEESFAQAKYLAGRRSVAASASLGDKPVVIHADAPMLGAAILEICVNAFRFARSEIRLNLSGEPLLLLVEDDGPGFREEQVAPGEGLGTSLRMATRVIGAHGGTLAHRVSTLPKRCDTPGACIAIELPRRVA